MRKTNNWQQFYDQKWLQVYPSFFSDEQTVKDVDLIIDLVSLKKKNKILDLCCGYGRHSIELAKRGYQVMGFDYSQPFLQQARQKAAKLRLKIPFFQKDIAKFDEEEKFDVILMMYPAIFYLNKDKARKIFAKIGKSLKSGGWLLIKTVNAEKYKERFIKKGQRCQKGDFYKIEENFEVNGIKVFQLRMVNIKTQQERIKLVLSSKGKKKEVKTFVFNYYRKDQLEEILASIGFKMKKPVEAKDGDLPTAIYLFRKNAPFQSLFKLPQIIEDIQDIRENRWTIPLYEYEPLLISKAKSKNLEIQESGLRLLEKSWLVDSKNSLESAQVVDIAEELERFSKKQKKLIFKSFFAIETIKGCNGGCYFCPLGIRNKIEYFFSFESLKIFYNRYSYYLGYNIPQKILENLKSFLFHKFPRKYRYLHLSPPQNKETLIYWDGDPFPYRDRQKTLFDIYQLMAGFTRSRFSPYLSSSIPPGSQRLFVEFFMKIARKYFQKKIRIPVVRISLAKHNVQRIETTLKFLYYYLLSKNFNFKQIHELFKKSFIFHIRDEDTLFKVGPLVKSGDGIRDIFSPLCEDGFILSPRNSRIQIMVAANKFCPSGGINIFSQEEKFIKNLIRQYSLFNFAFHDQNSEYLDDNQKHLSHLRQLILQNKVFLPLPKKISGGLFLGKEGSSKIERIIFVLSRYSLSLRHFLSYSGGLSPSWIPIDLKITYFQIASKEFKSHRQIIAGYLQKAEKELLRMRGKDRNKKKLKELQYFFQLTNFHLRSTDLIMNLIDKNRNLDLVMVIINLLLKIGSKEIKKFKMISKNLDVLIHIENYEQELITALILVFSQITSKQINNLDKIINHIKKLFSEEFTQEIFLHEKERNLNFTFDQYLIFSQKIKPILKTRIMKYWEVEKNQKSPEWFEELEEALLIFLIKSNK
jgi:SAM-dependent methyltransferase